MIRAVLLMQLQLLRPANMPPATCTRPVIFAGQLIIPPPSTVETQSSGTLQAPLLHPSSGPQAQRRPQSGVVYVLSKPSIRARSGSSFWRRFLLETLYTFMIRNSRPPTAKWMIPPDDVLEIDVVHTA